VKVCAKYGENSRYFDLNVSPRGQQQGQQQQGHGHSGQQQWTGSWMQDHDSSSKHGLVDIT
jgi:hypothetical protein